VEISKFTKEAPGRLVKHSGRHFFIPDDLPPKWNFPTDLWPLLVEAHRQLGLLEGVGRYLPNPAILLRPLIDREAIESSRIEGTYATPRELLLFELAQREPASDADPVNDWKEVHNYRKALEFAAVTDLPLSMRLIRDLHRQLLSDIRGKEKAPGEFRRVPVAIGTQNSTRFIPPPANEIVKALDHLERYIHAKRRAFDPLVDCFLVHYQFETIHPFMDGNGRVGRLLLILMIQRFCGLTKAWFHMSSFFANHRDAYVDCLFNISARADWTPWIKFCLEGVVFQCQDTIQRCDKLIQIKQRFMRALTGVKGSSRLAQIVEMVFSNPFITIVELAERLKVYYQTAQADVARLAAIGILRELPTRRPKTYFAPEIYQVAYEDLGSAEQ